MNRKNFGFVVLFLLSLFLFFISCLCILKFSILNKSYILNKFVSVDFYNKQYDEIIKEMSYYTNQSGFSDDFLNDVFSVNTVKVDTDNVISDLYVGRYNPVDVSKIESKLNDKIADYIKANDYQNVDDSEIDFFVSKMSSIYSDEVGFMGLTSKVTFLPKLVGTIDEVLAILILLFVVLVVINKKVFHRKSYGVLFFTCSFLFIFLDIYVFGYIDFKNLFIYNDVVSDVIKSIISDLFYTSVFLIVLYFALGFFTSFFRKTVKYR